MSLGAGGRADMRGAAVRAAVEARGPSEDEEAAPLADGGPHRSHTTVKVIAARPELALLVDTAGSAGALMRAEAIAQCSNADMWHEAVTCH